MTLTTGNKARLAVIGERLARCRKPPFDFAQDRQTALRLRSGQANRKPDQGFTLLEMIVVSSMIVVISLAIYSTFSNGIKIWERTQGNTKEEDLNIFFDRFVSDLRGSFAFKGLDFLGEETRLEFSTLVTSQRLGKRTVGKVAYFYDDSSRSINKEERDFSHIHRDDEGIIEEGFSGVRSFKLLYYFYDDEKKEYFWLEEWDKESSPLAVRMIFEFDDGKEVIEYTKTVNIPVSGS
ncbi:MAG: prepilin-type N-terminal cleavage/methylation domain-containing protein [Candidatus Omnitrophota bacterium]